MRHQPGFYKYVRSIMKNTRIKYLQKTIHSYHIHHIILLFQWQDKDLPI